MYPAEHEIKHTTERKTSASYLDLLLSIGSDGQLPSSLYDKRDDFNFHITNFSFLGSNIPSSPAYGVFIWLLIRYARVCSFYECYEYFILRVARLSSKFRSLHLPNVTWHSGTWPYTVTHSTDQTLHQFMNLLPNCTLLLILTLLPNFGRFP